MRARSRAASPSLARRFPVAAAGLLALVVLALGSACSPAGPSADSGAGPQAAPTSGAASSPSTAQQGDGPEGGELLAVQGADEPAARPVRVQVDALGIDSRLDELAVDGRGGLETPPRWQVAGWFGDGPRPGEDGPAVIAGHVDSPTGPAVFARLSELEVGDTVRVSDAAGVDRTFRVDRTTSTPRTGFPTEAVYGPTPDPQLRLITCDGAYDADQGGYQDNLLVFATEVDA